MPTGASVETADGHRPRSGRSGVLCPCVIAPGEPPRPAGRSRFKPRATLISMTIGRTVMAVATHRDLDPRPVPPFGASWPRWMDIESTPVAGERSSPSHSPPTAWMPRDQAAAAAGPPRLSNMPNSLPHSTLSRGSRWNPERTWRRSAIRTRNGPPRRKPVNFPDHTGFFKRCYMLPFVAVCWDPAAFLLGFPAFSAACPWFLRPPHPK